MKLRRSKEKILMVIWAIVVGCGLAAGIAIFAANESETWGTTGKARRVSQWNFDIESVLYFSSGKLGEASQNRGLNEIEYWQPINQQYGLGYMNFSAKARGIDHVCSSVVFYPDNSSWRNVYGSSAHGPITTKININNENSTNRWNADAKFSLDVDGKGLLYHLPDLKYEKPNNKEGIHKEGLCKFKANGNRGTRNDMNFVDHIGGAQYLDERYDVREYVSAAYGKGKTGDSSADGNCPIIRVKGVNLPGALNSSSSVIGTPPDQPVNANRPYASLSRQCIGATILEFHFYPHHTLENLDKNLKFTTLKYERTYTYYVYIEPYPCDCDEKGCHSTCGDRWDSGHTGRFPIEYYNVYMPRSDSTTFPDHCPTEFYRRPSKGINFTEEEVLQTCFTPEFKNRYLLTFEAIKNTEPEYLGTSNGPRAYGNGYSKFYITHDTYSQYLNSKEEVSFDGFLAVDDIDGNNEGYTPLKGVNRVFLTNKTRIIRAAIPNTFKPGTWLSLYCSSSDPFCNKEWRKASSTKGSTSEDKNVSIYMQYTSTPDNPLTIAYYTNGHASGIDSDGVPILYVVEDIQGYSDTDGGIVKMLKDKLKAYKAQFKEIYGEDLSVTIKTLKENGMPSEEASVNADTVLIYLEAEKYTQYDPYIINKVILGEDGDNGEYEIPWYRDPALKNYIEPGTTDITGTDKYVKAGVTNATEIIPSEWQGKNFAVYFTKISRIVEDYQNTCFSNNTSLESE